MPLMTFDDIQRTEKLSDIPLGGNKSESEKPAETQRNHRYLQNPLNSSPERKKLPHLPNK